MPTANLTCYKVECSGEFEYLGDRGAAALFECRECGAELSQSAVEELAQGDGAIAQLAEVLLNGGAAE